MTLVPVEVSKALEIFREPGAGVTGWCLRTFEPDDKTPALTYTDASGDSPMPNPAYLDAPGNPVGVATVSKHASIFVPVGKAFCFVVEAQDGTVVFAESIGPLQKPEPRPKPAHMILGNWGFITEEI